MARPSIPPRERILAHAIKEFSARGFAGARVERIARLAKVNKRMLFYYFDDKESLFHAALDNASRSAVILQQVPDDPVESLLFWREFYTRNEAWIRLLLWEGLELKKPRSIPERQAFWAASIARRQRVSGPGGWSASLDTRQLLLAEIGLLVAPLAFPHVTQLIFGQSPRAPEFQREHAQFLAGLGRLLTQEKAP